MPKIFGTKRGGKGYSDDGDTSRSVADTAVLGLSLSLDLDAPLATLIVRKVHQITG